MRFCQTLWRCENYSHFDSKSARFVIALAWRGCYKQKARLLAFYSHPSIPNLFVNKSSFVEVMGIEPMSSAKILKLSTSLVYLV